MNNSLSVSLCWHANELVGMLYLLSQPWIFLRRDRACHTVPNRSHRSFLQLIQPAASGECWVIKMCVAFVFPLQAH